MSGRLPIARGVALVGWLVVLWLMLWADLSIANELAAIVLAVVLVIFTRGAAAPAGAETARISPLRCVVFLGHVLGQLVVSNLQLAWEILTPQNSIDVGTIDVPLRSRSAAIAMAVSNVVTLTPGTVTIDVAPDTSSITIGVLHLHDPDQLRASVQHTEALAIRAFGTPMAREALARSTDRERASG